MGRREARRGGGCGHRGAAGRRERGHGPAQHREGARGRVHHGDRGEGRADGHRAQHGAPAQLQGEARHRRRDQGDGQALRVDSRVRALRAEYDAIARRLDTTPGGSEREVVKREIIAFFKQVDSLIGELSELKEEIRKLVERYKQLAPPAAEASAPEFTGTRPAVHADHIGASTFIEKGWSLISLGDHAGAIQALQKALKLGPNLIEAHYELGRAYWFSGDQARAQQTWEEGFKANKFNPWGKKCQETLALVQQGQEPPRT